MLGSRFKELCQRLLKLFRSFSLALVSSRINLNWFVGEVFGAGTEAGVALCSLTIKLFAKILDHKLHDFLLYVKK